MRTDATILLATLLLAAPGAHAASFTYTVLEAPGHGSIAISGLPGALNGHDQVVGTATSHGTAEGFVWQGGQFAFYPQVRSLAAIDAAGLAVGLPASGDGYASIDTISGTIHTYRDGFRGKLFGIDASGEVVAQGESGGQTTGFLLHEGAKAKLMVPGATSTAPTAIDDAGTVTGSYASGSQTAGFVYADGTYTTFAPPNAVNTNPVFITADGVIGGSFTSMATYGPVGFVRRGGQFYGYLPGNADFSEVTGIGPGHEIVGSFEDMHIKGHGFVFRAGTFYQIDVPGAADTAIDGVNARGTLVGTIMAADGSQHVFVATCPPGESCTE